VGTGETIKSPGAKPLQVFQWVRKCLEGKKVTRRVREEDFREGDGGQVCTRGPERGLDPRPQGL
jgi:hypothetical protein